MRDDELSQFGADGEETAVVRVGPVAADALTLGRENLQRGACRGQVGHRHQVVQVEVGARRLGGGRPDEQVGLPAHIAQVGEGGLDGLVEVTDRGVVGGFERVGVTGEILVEHQRAGRGRRDLCVQVHRRVFQDVRFDLDVAGSLQEDEAGQ